MDGMSGKLYDIAGLRQQIGVFADRRDAGRILAAMLQDWKGVPAVVLGIPSGGIPVAVEVAGALNLPLDAAVVSKILLPWNTESGFGAVGFDGTVWINEEVVSYYDLDDAAIHRQTEEALAKVQRRVRLFRDDRPWPDLQQQTVILVDDGIAAGSTLRVAVQAVRNIGGRQIVVAVPTAHLESLAPILEKVDALYCANIREGPQFAVAAAYRHWDDVDEVEAVRMLGLFLENSHEKGGEQ
ncbi:MAG TPA: phosphoribosyltransferase [Desulfobulbus sp.]|nr:phosphoribosyltransferase [Desulfobulbus sp.]